MITEDSCISQFLVVEFVAYFACFNMSAFYNGCLIAVRNFVSIIILYLQSDYLFCLMFFLI